jgi:BirA family biotin operon repressor/biotin-[acetyl-CoA-carboxylase] ligase
MPPSPDAALLRRLRSVGDGFVIGSELGEPGAVAGRIAILRGAGYEIEQHPHLGYRLVSAPDRLIADDILSRMPESRWIREVLVFEKTNSTNDVIAGLARDGAAAGVAAFAEQQTAGRGRLGRRWQSGPRQGLWFSLLLRPDWPVDQWPRLTLWIAWAVARGIAAYATGSLPGKPIPRVMLKWPNDLFVAGRKVAGILVESSLGENGFAIAGIGLNVNQPAFEPRLDATATSLRIHAGVTLDRNALAAALLASLDESFSFMPSGFRQIIDWANEVDYIRGRWIRATAGTVNYEGTAEGLDADGALVIRTAGGDLIRLSAGEVTHFFQGAV